MNTFRIFTSEGRSLRFQGTLIASVESTHLAATRADAWFELAAYEHENGQWVTSIAMKTLGDTSDEVVDYYCTKLLASAEDFLYDFEPVQILPDDLTSGSPEFRSALAIADQSYYAAVRRLIHEMEVHEADRQASPKDMNAVLSDMECSDENGIGNRIKLWLHL